MLLFYFQFPSPHSCHPWPCSWWTPLWDIASQNSDPVSPQCQRGHQEGKDGRGLRGQERGVSAHLSHQRFYHYFHCGQPKGWWGFFVWVSTICYLNFVQRNEFHFCFCCRFRSQLPQSTTQKPCKCLHTLVGFNFLHNAYIGNAQFSLNFLLPFSQEWSRV